MSKKRTEKITTEVLKRVSIVISDIYNIDEKDIIDHIKNIPESLKCNFTLTKGKRKGQICGVILCPHHQYEVSSVNEPNNIPLDQKEEEKYDSVNEPNNIPLDQKEEEKYDSDMAAAIEESIMYANINAIRRRRGLAPLYG